VNSKTVKFANDSETKEEASTLQDGGKPWEKTEEKEIDYRWDVCENCQ
jgi:hypothetical protein